MNAETFEKLTGHAPEQDDLERVNCKQAGFVGHAQCGVCNHCGLPRFIPKFEDGKLTCDHREQEKGTRA